MSGIRRLNGEARLAIVLLTVALLMSVSRTSVMVSYITNDLDLSAVKLGLVLSAGGLAGLSVVGVASWWTAGGRIPSCRWGRSPRPHSPEFPPLLR